MSPSPILVPTSCAICETADNATELYPANFSVHDFNPDVFSARRMPDKIHYRIVRCQSCGLVRSDPIIEPAALSELYAKSSQTYDAEVPNLIGTYARYLHRTVRGLAGVGSTGRRNGSLLEIGCGNGFFLEKALDYGFEHVIGIEPSRQAVEKGSRHIRQSILCDVLRPGLLQPGQFDIICMFQVFDHLPDPNGSLEVCFDLLKSGGYVLALNHDAASFSAKALGEKSPIIDIEHTYLYDRRSMARMFVKHGFEVLQTGSAFNRYSLQYLAQLTPLTGRRKIAVLNFLKKTRIGRLSLTIGLGNLFIISKKPIPRAG